MLGRTRWHDSSNWAKRHSLSLVLAALLAWQTATYLVVAWRDWTAEQAAHGQDAGLWAFAVYSSAELNLSMLADTYGALLLVLVTKWFYEQGSAESNDGDSQ